MPASRMRSSDLRELVGDDRVRVRVMGTEKLTALVAVNQISQEGL